MSLPSRERGLKLYTEADLSNGNKSLPSRERGLKLTINNFPQYAIFVAPLAGAWIEIVYTPEIAQLQAQSLPSRERGLKLFQNAAEMAGQISRSPRGSAD